MKTVCFTRWLNPSLGLLLLFLQRTPVLRWLAAAEFAAPARIVHLLRTALLPAASLGAYHTLSGATEFVTSAPSPVQTTVGASFNFAFTVTGTPEPPSSYAISGTLPPGLTIPGLSGGVLNDDPGQITGTPSASGTYSLSIQAYDLSDLGGDTNGVQYTVTIVVQGADGPLTIAGQPEARSAPVGGSATFSVSASGSGALSYQWRKNAADIGGATANSFTLNNIQSIDAGLYSVRVTDSSGSITSTEAMLGVVATEKFAGSYHSPAEFQNILHPTGRVFDQVLLTGPAATITADPGQVTRMSFVDVNDDIVQVEFSGSGSLTLTLDNPTGPALPAHYNQNIQYMKGHPSVFLTGAGIDTNVSLFSVGRANAVNQALFRDDVTYDGHAGAGVVALGNPTGAVAAIRMANTIFFGVSGVTGMHAPGVQINGPVFAADIVADAAATPVLRFASVTNSDGGVRITGGDLRQENGAAIQVAGVDRVLMAAGTDSHGRFEPAQSNQARFERDGADVTDSIVQNP